MKKVIAAAAGLMLAGAMVTTASAAVSFGGDARVRGYYESNYDLGAVDGVTGARVNEEDAKMNSRIRVKINADAKGGAYARARIKIADGTFGLGSQTGKTNVSTDYGYIGVPIGPVTIEGGRMPSNLTKFTYWDNRDDMVKGIWKNDMTHVELWYVKSAEIPEDVIDDNDINGYAAFLNQKFAGDWAMTVYGLYTDDETPADASGFAGSINFSGPAGPVSFAAEFAYVEEELTGTPDNGYGGFLQAGMDFGATSVTLNGGFTKDGFAADNDFGFIMIGGASSITPGAFDTGGKGVGVLGDTTWIGGIVGFKASEALSLKGILAYADIDDFGDAFEISGSLVYAISDGADFQWDIGYLNVSTDSDFDDEESPFGTAATLSISF